MIQERIRKFGDLVMCLSQELSQSNQSSLSGGPFGLELHCISGQIDQGSHN